MRLYPDQPEVPIICRAKEAPTQIITSPDHGRQMCWNVGTFEQLLSFQRLSHIPRFALISFGGFNNRSETSSSLGHIFVRDIKALIRDTSLIYSYCYLLIPARLCYIYLA